VRWPIRPKGSPKTAPDNAPQAGSASTSEIDEKESARKKDDTTAARSIEDTDGAPNNHEAGRNHDKGDLDDGAAIETEENKNEHSKTWTAPRRTGPLEKGHYKE